MNHHTAKMFCPKCITEIDGATNLEGGDQTPEDGDISICIYCTEVLEYADGTLIKGNVDKLEEEQKTLIFLVQESIRGTRTLN